MGSASLAIDYYRFRHKNSSEKNQQDIKKVVFASSLAQRFEFLMALRLKLISSRR